MENNLEFIIKSAVLVHYCGPGGDVVIPKGVWEIGWAAFAANRQTVAGFVAEVDAVCDSAAKIASSFNEGMNSIQSA